MEDILNEAFHSFLGDRADSEYQQGYLAGYLDLYSAMGYSFMRQSDLDALEEQTEANID